MWLITEVRDETGLVRLGQAAARRSVWWHEPRCTAPWLIAITLAAAHSHFASWLHFRRPCSFRELTILARAKSLSDCAPLSPQT